MTSVWGITTVRNEADIIRYTLSHMESEGVAGLIVADNLSTDETRHEIEAYKYTARIPVIVLDDQDPAHDQSRKMTALAGMAAEHGAEWIVPFDGDELWFGGSRSIRDVLDALDPSVVVLPVPSLTHVETGHDVDDENPYKRMIWRRPDPSSLPKICYRYSPDLTIWHGNDGVTRNGRLLPLKELCTGMEIRHFPIRSFDQFSRKVVEGRIALQKAKDLPAGTGSHWMAYGRVVERYGLSALRAIYFSRLFFAEPQLQGFVKNPAPWRRWER